MRAAFVCRAIHRSILTAGLVLATAAAARAHGNVRHDFKLINGVWWNGQDFAPRTVYTVGGEFRDSYDGKVEATLDLQSRFVVPPFADAHNHGFSGFGDQQKAIADSLRLGVFYLKNPNNLGSMVEQARSSVNQPRSLDVVYANGGLTATGGHPAQIYDQVAPQIGRKAEQMAGDAYFFVDSSADLDAKWAEIQARKPDFIKVYLKHSEQFAQRHTDPALRGQYGLDPALLLRIVERAHAAGLRVTAHAESAADYRAAIAAGVDEMAHLPLAPLTDADARATAAHHVTVVTTTQSHWDSHGIADLDGLHRANLKLLQSAGVTLALGTDNAKTVVDEAENIRRLAPFDDRTLLKIALEQTPLAIFPARRIGCLKEGCEASFLALDGNPLADWGALRKINLRMKQGFVLDVKPRIADAIAPILEKGTGANAVEAYRKLVNDSPDGYEVSEQQLNLLGYDMLKKERAADAVAIMRLNSELYPKSANAFDSLADACEAARDKACVQEASKRVLELLPSQPEMPEGMRKALEASANRRLHGGRT